MFHVGVLARLAELDLLRRVDVISSVSGGSIIAAYYYLKVKSLLEKTGADGQEGPGREDYLRIIAEIETDFLEAVQKNMFIRTYLDPVKNARMLGTDYSNTERLSELLTTYFYRPVSQPPTGGNKRRRLQLKDISIRPPTQKRLSDTRIPSLIINATSLNTGHLWQFTNESIGEQPTSYEAGNDSIDFYKKFRFDDDRLTIEDRKILYNITLGQAVAASCCVPGFFEPLRIPNLYKSNREFQTVRLVDGGLVDNQGLVSLFTENCTHIICSDASDILRLEHHPSVQLLDVALRANDILIDRIRSRSLNKLFAHGPGRFVLFDLGDKESRVRIFPADSEKMVSALTRIRTDLDSFTDREAYSLMYYGYRLSCMEMESNAFELIREPSPPGNKWRFLEIEDRFFSHDAARKELLFHLEVGSRQMFKIFMLKKALPYMILLPVPLLALMLAMNVIVRSAPMLFLGILICGILVVIYTQNRRILRFIDNVGFLRRMKQQLLKILLSLRLPEPLSYLMALAAWMQLAIFDRLFLRYGRVRRKSGHVETRPPYR